MRRYCSIILLSVLILHMLGANLLVINNTTSKEIKPENDSWENITPSASHTKAVYSREIQLDESPEEKVFRIRQTSLTNVWLINGTTVVIQNTVYKVAKNISVINGGALVIKNATLLFENGTTYYIEVSNGNLTLIDSIITTQTGILQSVTISKGLLFINSSVINATSTQFASINIYNARNVKILNSKMGVLSLENVTNITIDNARIFPENFDNVSNMVIKNSIIVGDYRKTFFINESSNITITNCHLKANTSGYPEFYIKIYYSSDISFSYIYVSFNEYIKELDIVESSVSFSKYLYTGTLLYQINVDDYGKIQPSTLIFSGVTLYYTSFTIDGRYFVTLSNTTKIVFDNCLLYHVLLRFSGSGATLLINKCKYTYWKTGDIIYSKVSSYLNITVLNVDFVFGGDTGQEHAFAIYTGSSTTCYIRLENITWSVAEEYNWEGIRTFLYVYCCTKLVMKNVSLPFLNYGIYIAGELDEGYFKNVNITEYEQNNLIGFFADYIKNTYMDGITISVSGTAFEFWYAENITMKNIFVGSLAYGILLYSSRDIHMENVSIHAPHVTLYFDACRDIYVSIRSILPNSYIRISSSVNLYLQIRYAEATPHNIDMDIYSTENITINSVLSRDIALIYILSYDIKISRCSLVFFEDMAINTLITEDINFDIYLVNCRVSNLVELTNVNGLHILDSELNGGLTIDYSSEILIKNSSISSDMGLVIRNCSHVYLDKDFIGALLLANVSNISATNSKSSYAFFTLIRYAKFENLTIYFWIDFGANIWLLSSSIGSNLKIIYEAPVMFTIPPNAINTEFLTTLEFKNVCVYVFDYMYNISKILTKFYFFYGVDNPQIPSDAGIVVLASCKNVFLTDLDTLLSSHYGSCNIVLYNCSNVYLMNGIMNRTTIISRIFMYYCKNVLIANITIEKSDPYLAVLYNCSHVEIRNIYMINTVYSSLDFSRPVASIELRYSYDVAIENIVFGNITGIENRRYNFTHILIENSKDILIRGNIFNGTVWEFGRHPNGYYESWWGYYIFAYKSSDVLVYLNNFLNATYNATANYVIGIRIVNSSIAFNSSSYGNFWNIYQDYATTMSFTPTDSDGDGIWDNPLITTNVADYYPLVNLVDLSDADKDLLGYWEEALIYNTNPTNSDSDSDSLTDFEEIFIFTTNPLSNDSDGDSISDYDEVKVYNTDPLKSDSDGDGLTDYEEIVYGTNPLLEDSDFDKLTDYQEVKIYNTNPLSNDTDGDKLSDYDEVKVYNTDPLKSDSDGDGLTDYEEIKIYNTNATNPDSDSDGLTDYDELKVYNTDPLNPDTDSDGLIDSKEIEYNSNPRDQDTDKDGLLDGDEVKIGTSPTSNDTDGDGLTDYQEIKIYKTNPTSNDTDADGLTDYEEIMIYNTNPNDPDTDSDRLTDYEEVRIYHTDPLNFDTDSDGLTDYDEVKILSTNPFSNDSDNDLLSDYDEVMIYHTNPLSNDTDADGISDYQEVKVYHINPNSIDTDSDGLTDYEEIKIYNTNATNPDTDNDGLTDYEEVKIYTTNPKSNDTDGDGLTDYEEIVVYHTNPNSVDTDGDGLTDYEEAKIYKTNITYVDSDFDNITDYQEVKVYHTNPLSNDSDGDGLTDYEEIVVYHTNPNSVDTDEDDLTDYEEIYVYHTEPLNNDTDSDKLSDGEEITYGTNPLNNDTDSDGLTDYQEIKVYKTDPLKIDSEGDGLSDFDEVIVYHTNPNNPDSDRDGLTDYQEVKVYNTNPNNEDTDNDGLQDFAEVSIYTTNPKSNDTDGDGLTDYEEIVKYGTNPLSADTDGDGLTDYQEIKIYNTNPKSIDTDGDGLSDYQEVKVYYTNPNDQDTDNDGLTDYQEVSVYKTNATNVDSDGDGLSDGDEILGYHTNATNVDSDGDGLTDYEEIVVYHTNPNSVDTDGDGLTDYAEIFDYHTNPNDKDTDDDGVSDGDEILYFRTNALSNDTDGDTMPDGWEVQYGLNPLTDDSGKDPDNDGLTNIKEYKYRSDPKNPDTDGDTMPDGWEVQYGLNPIDPTDAKKDIDGDGLKNYEEYAYDTSPRSIDTDNDGLTDYEEAKIYNTNPLSNDTDGDGLSDYQEVKVYGTNPNAWDTDGDGISDGEEIKRGTNPLESEYKKYVITLAIGTAILIVGFIAYEYISRKRRKELSLKYY